ncbi:MAG: ATP-grasp domain-containing protein [Methanobrevibacter sp.]|nr:ATP-grasp domain-containing protein [Candidatus Methanovirga basalitermitum]
MKKYARVGKTILRVDTELKMKNSTTLNKKNAVICVNPHDRQAHVLDFYKKYNFTPILIYSETKDAIGDMGIGINEQVKNIKSRIPNLVYLVDKGNDFDKIVKELKEKYNVLAVCPGYDVSLEYVDRLSKALGVHGNDPNTTALRRDKGWVNKQLFKNKIRTPITMEFYLNTSAIDISNKILNTIKTFPIVLKPYEGSGSRGVQIISSKKDLVEALNDCLKFKEINPIMSNKFLAQEYIDGEEGFLDFYSFNGKHLLTDAWMYTKQIFSGINLAFKTTLIMKNTPLLAKATAYCKKVLDAIGYK